MSRRRRLPDWWLHFTEAHPAVPTVVAVLGLATIMVLLAPAVAHPTDRGSMIDSFSTVVRSGTLTDEAVSLRDTYHAWVPREVRDYVGSLLFNPALYLLIPFVLLLEALFPANPSQPLVSKGFWQDFVWFVAGVPTRLLILGAAAEVLRHFYDDHLSLLTIRSATAWPLAVQVIAALLVGEFLNWGSHVIRHKVGTLWLFHAVHHSQKELNVFTDDRSHFVDRLVSSIVMFLPFYMFQVPSLYAVAVVGLWVSIHSRFVHANVKINLGWLGWIVSSPQFHRVHHAANPAYWDTNYGGVLSIFDHMFGTACPSSDIYPETGIHDAQFPDEGKRRPSQFVGNWLRQIAHPFRQIFSKI